MILAELVEKSSLICCARGKIYGWFHFGTWSALVFIMWLVGGVLFHVEHGGCVFHHPSLFHVEQSRLSSLKPATLPRICTTAELITKRVQSPDEKIWARTRHYQPVAWSAPHSPQIFANGNCRCRVPLDPWMRIFLSLHINAPNNSIE